MAVLATLLVFIICLMLMLLAKINSVKLNHIIVSFVVSSRETVLTWQLMAISKWTDLQFCWTFGQMKQPIWKTRDR